jgi:hypothetical protein
MIIPIGIDCGMADFLRKNNLRSLALPFDWNVTYNGVSECIDDNFKFFIEPLNNRFNKYGTYFTHDFENIDLLNEDKEKYTIRCQRFCSILEECKDEIIFCRKGHASHNHFDYNVNNITNDIDDAEKLDIVLQKRYPMLKYKIIVILVCGKCFNSTQTYKGNSDRIEIYNIATAQADATMFENLCRDIFKL